MIRRLTPSRTTRSATAARAKRAVLPDVARCCFWGGIVMAALSFGDGPAWLLALSGFPIALGFVFGDIYAARRGGLTPITIFAFASALTALANATGLLAADTAARSRYFSYAADNYLLLASQLSIVGMAVTVVGFKLISRMPAARLAFRAMPAIRGDLPDRLLVVAGPLVGLAVVAVHARSGFQLVGSIMSTVYLLPHICAFLLARAGTARRVRGALALALVVATAEGIRALFLAYLRTDIAAPFVALALGALLGARSLAPLRSRTFIPLYVFAAFFIIYFGAFAQARGTAVGLGRLEAVTEGAPPNAPFNAQPHPSFWARLTNFNQLSQVGRITAEDGYVHGQTLEYLGFVFIPRFLWRDKPIVQKGGWFAWRIGQAWIRPDGRYSNAINMTVPGELYLNFGWFGVLTGSFLFGAFIAMLWSRTGFWGKHSSAVGAAFGYYLFWTSLSLAADLESVVTLIATYFIFVAAGFAVRSLPNRRANDHRSGSTVALQPVRNETAGAGAA